MVRSSSGIPNRLALNGGFGPGWFESILQLEPSSDKDLKYKMPVGDFYGESLYSGLERKKLECR
jgi:hypothetical protein